MSTPELRRGPLPSLTGMRFVAAFLVFFTHSVMLAGLFADDGVARTLGNPALASGFVGVSFFFVLSGFVLTWSAREGDTRRGFWRRRFFKIYPVHFVAWTASALLGLTAASLILEVANLPALFLLHALPPIPFSINEPSWSLSVEAVFYLLFPWLFAWVRRIPAARLWLCASLLVAAIFSVALVVTVAIPSEPGLGIVDMTRPQFWLVYTFPPIRAIEFVLGMVMARIVQTGRWVPIRLGPAIALVVAAFACQIVVARVPYGVVAPVIVPLALLIPAAATADLTGRPTWFSTPWMQWLGRISYAFFMIHYLVLYFGHVLLLGGRAYPTPVAVGVLLVALAATIGLSYLMYRYVEQPAMRRWSRPSPKPRMPEGADVSGQP
jgi:peptidoglycan/LPS O-acetylase OafA/YrhL